MANNSWTQILNKVPQGLSQDGNTLASFTTAADIFPAITLDAGYFVSRRLTHIRARGIWAATATPTYTFSVKVGAVVAVTSAAITVSAITNQAWEIDVQLQTRADGSTGTLLGMGDLNMGGVTGVNYLPATGTAPTASSALDFSTALALSIQIACSASSASNTVKGIILEVKSIN